MRRLVLLVLLAFDVPAEKSLEGLWAGRRHFGPDVRGILLIENGRAQIAGREALVTIRDGVMAFALPGDEGRFRGQIAGDRVTGHWVQPAGVSTGFEFATPVTLAKQSGNRWRGTVQPIDDRFTAFLPVSADGSAFLVNPERNFGRITDVRRIVLDGTQVKLLGRNGNVILEGRYDSDADTITIFSWRGGYSYDLHRAGAADQAAFHPRRTGAAWRTPADRDDGWSIGSLEDAGIDAQALASFLAELQNTKIDSVQAVRTHAFLVARHGKLVVEEYFHGTSPDEPHDTRSAAKSLTTVLAGAAEIDPATPVYETMLGGRSADPRKNAITLEHLLTMSAGLDCDDNDDSSPGREDTMQEQTAQPDWYRYTLDLKMIRDPGASAVYCSGLPNLAGGVIARKTGQWLPDLFRDLIAGPLQFRYWGLPLTPTGDVYTGGGMRLIPRDFLKLGQMMLDGGRWKGKQILRREFAARATSPLYAVGGSALNYGFLFWTAEYPWKDGTVRAYFASGNGGQIIMTVPDLDLVIGFFGGNYGDAASGHSRKVYVPKNVLPAIR